VRAVARRRRAASAPAPISTISKVLGSGTMELMRSDGTPPGPCWNHCPFMKFVRVALPPKAP
jgi:hypothetical protein